MDFAMRMTLQASSRLAVHTRPCPSCSSHALTHPSRSTRSIRYYTTTPRRYAIGESGHGAAARMGREVLSQMSDSGAKTRTVSKAQMQKDLGLFPGTFTQRPFKEYLFLLAKEPKTFFRLTWKLIKKPFTNTFGIWYNLNWHRRQGFRITSSAPLRKKPIPLHLTGRISEALRLHRELNQAIAEGDRNWLRKNCCTGLAEKAINRIERRGAGVKEHWRLARYTGHTFVPPWPLTAVMPFAAYKVVNDVVGQIPIASDALLRQVIVRISSTQEIYMHSFARNPERMQGKSQVDWIAPDGTNFTPTQRQLANTKDRVIDFRLVEYVVLQKMIWQGEDEPWKIWGTIPPLELPEIKELLADDQAQGGLADRMRALMPGYGGVGGPPMM